MKEKTTKGELLVVEDFTEINRAVREGWLTPEEAEERFGKGRQDGSNFNTPEGEAFLKTRKGKIFIGGGDVATINGLNPWKSRRMLQLELLGLVESTTLPTQAFRFRFGHDYEDGTASMCARILRSKGVDVVYIPCEYGYIFTGSPFLLIHPDGYFLSRKTRELAFLGEVKTTANGSETWKAVKSGLVPPNYNCQTQVYMHTLDIDECYLLCWNCERDPNGFIPLLIKRDDAYAISLLEECDKFVRDTEAGILYEDDDFLPGEAARVFGTVDPTAGYKKLARKTQHTLEQLERLKKQRDAINEELREGNRLLRQIESEEKKLNATLFSRIGNAPGGVLETSKAIYTVDVTRDFSFDKEVKQATAEQYPEVWKAITEMKPTMKAKLTIEPKDDPEHPKDADNKAS